MHSTHLPLTTIAQQVVGRVISIGDVAIDATAGNGHDTLFLARCVGATGSVLAIDLQETALAKTRERLVREYPDVPNCRLQRGDHALLMSLAPIHWQGRVAAIMFNLGYLPSGDKRLITTASSTLAALYAACALLKAGGVLSILAYTGHPGGREEAAAVEQFCRGLSPSGFTVEQIQSPDQRRDPPCLWLVRKLDPQSDSSPA